MKRQLRIGRTHEVASNARRRDRGASVIEATLALPVLFLLFFGLIETGVALKTYSTAADSVRAGGRMASVAGADPLADAAALRRVADAAGVNASRINVVVVWHASGPGTSIPTACLPVIGSGPNIVSMGVSDGGIDTVGACNVYVNPGMPGGAFAMARGELAQPSSYYFGCLGPSDPDASHKVDCMWPAMHRRAESTPRASSPPRAPDFVGVYLRIDHRVLTSLLGATISVTDATINLIEPNKYDVTA